jgi:type I restriction enzyme R subunit
MDNYPLSPQKNRDPAERDPAGRRAGASSGSRVRREVAITPGRIEGGGRRGKPLICDYVLEYRNAKLAVIEAKALDRELTEGVGQAKDYAGKLAVRFAYATNGRGLYGIDMQTGREGELAGYPTPEALWALTHAEANAWRDRFAAVPFEDKGGSHPSRYYQDIAVERVMEAIAAKRQRILLTLATGTGKTFIAFQIAWKLFHSRWNLSGAPTRRPRILFLADRNILANQAYNAFSAFPEDAMVRRPGRYPPEGPGAQEREPVLHHLPNLHERPGRRRRALALLRRLSIQLLRLHRHRRVPPRRGE